MDQTQTEAKQFFADRVIQQANVERVTLSDAERRMLSWSESDPAFNADPALVEQLSAEISDAEYEAKIAGLLERRFAADLASSANAMDMWRQAQTTLEQGDHYILIMIERAVGSKMKRWWQFWR
jgi:hypothetical protein